MRIPSGTNQADKQRLKPKFPSDLIQDPQFHL